MKHLVMYSGGLCSYFAARRVIEEHGPKDVILLFADTRMEDEDLYRFVNDSTAQLGAKVTVVSDGPTPWEVFFDKRFLGNSMRDPCSLYLKRNLLNKWRYAFHERKEQEIRCFLGKDVSILKDRRGGGNKRMTLKDFRL